MTKVQCILCKDIIESTYLHDYVECTCGKTFVDGGKYYIRTTIYGKVLSKKNMNQKTLENFSEPVKKFSPSKYQQDIFNFIQNNTGNAIINASAGSGKTSTLIESLKFIPPDKTVVMCAFNKHIAAELKTKVPKNVWATTVHGAGYRTIQISGMHPKVDMFKVSNILNDILKEDNHLLKSMTWKSLNSFSRSCAFSIQQTVSLMKANLLPPTVESINEIVDFHDINTGEYGKGVFDYLVLKLIRESLLQKNIIDFDDMLDFPLKFGLKIPQYDFVYTDEIQDLNQSQIEFIIAMCKPGGRIIGVGDQNQSAYGFRGAAIDGMMTTIKRLNAVKLPLSISYRCPKSHVILAQQYVPIIEYADNAIDGTIENINIDSFASTVQSGDMIICRNNAPLIELAFLALDNKFKIRIRGKDIGRGLNSIIKETGAKHLRDLEPLLNKRYERKSIQLKKEGRNPEKLLDNHKAIMLLSRKVNTLEELCELIRTIFSDDSTEITFSSIHRAKGLEANRVFILDFDLIPSKFARQEWEMQQENNLAYIALTRSKDKLFFIKRGSSTPYQPQNNRL